MTKEMGKYASVRNESPQWKPYVKKYFHACDNSKMQTKTEIVLVQASMHVNNNKHSLKSG